MEHISFQNRETAIQNIGTANLPEVLQEGITFFAEAKAYYNTEKTVTEAIDLYLKKLNTHLQEKQAPTPTAPKDFSFVAKFVDLHQKTSNKKTIGNYIEKLQKAISQKQITRNSPVIFKKFKKN